MTTCRLARPKAVPYIEKTCRSFFDSHIFCVECSKALDSLDASPANRNCPACETRLTNPDDAVVTQLNPSEDYKTSVLSGLSPTIIMECAGRGLAFYSYQATQEMHATKMKFPILLMLMNSQHIPGVPDEESDRKAFSAQCSDGSGHL